jgi:hypothetical protein
VSIDKSIEKVFHNSMNAAIAESRIPDIQAQAHELDRRQREEWLLFNKGMNGETSQNGGIKIQDRIRELTKRQMEQWLAWMDGMLEVHRSMFVFRKPSPGQLEEHKAGMELAIDYCTFIKNLIDDPEFNEPDLVARLNVRIRQLQDAYDTFHDDTFSDAQAEELLKQVFPA